MSIPSYMCHRFVFTFRYGAVVDGEVVVRFEIEEIEGVTGDYEDIFIPWYIHCIHMALPIPTKLEEPLVKALDRLVEDGLYQSRSEAIRDSVRRLVERIYISRTRFLRIIAEIAAETIPIKYKNTVTDIIVYGSVASGQVSEDSDIDILVLVSTKGHESISQVEVGVHEVTYPISLASGTAITPIVLERERFLELYRKGEHFIGEIVKKGILLHGEILNELRE
ncbi:nucleotidyltransferase domain-containing protein [Candidatus Bathyarchaeota archaeon]|nr:nucleotidyltransferase domain-containing protein [Candidatus Bathyarchaeota archaeon]